MQTKTVPFFKVRPADRKVIINNLRELTNGDKTKLTAELAKTAIKSAIGQGSGIVGVPQSVQLSAGTGLYIPLRGEDLPAFTTVAQLMGCI